VQPQFSNMLGANASQLLSTAGWISRLGPKECGGPFSGDRPLLAISIHRVLDTKPIAFVFRVLSILLYIAKMTAHPGRIFNTQSPKFNDHPQKDCCHVYLVHQDGTIYWRPDTKFQNGGENSRVGVIRSVAMTG
jgi:hypothetical protein